MFRTVANFLHSVGDVLDDMLVGDAEFEAAEYASHPGDRPTFGDSRVRLLWDAAAQDRSYSGAVALLDRPATPHWDAGDDFDWEDATPVCPAEGRWRAAVMRFEASTRREGSVPAPAGNCL